jgi:large subunit ribosomal protein L6
MSRVGKAPISIPEGIEIKIDGNKVSVKGKLGELSETVHSDLSVKMEDGVLTVERPSETPNHRAMHGLYRSLINNMIIGVATGYKKELELVGVGYRASNQGQIIDLSLGYSHNIMLEVPAEVKVETEMKKGQNPLITLSSHDKQLVGSIAAKIRSFRKPEPYKGKGVRFVGEQIRRKAGKSAAK